MEKIGTPIAAAPGSASENVGLAARGMPPLACGARFAAPPPPPTNPPPPPLFLAFFVALLWLWCCFAAGLLGLGFGLGLGRGGWWLGGVGVVCGVVWGVVGVVE